MHHNLHSCHPFGLLWAINSFTCAIYFIDLCENPLETQTQDQLLLVKDFAFGIYN